jgi:hypothetical protein
MTSHWAIGWTHWAIGLTLWAEISGLARGTLVIVGLCWVWNAQECTKLAGRSITNALARSLLSRKITGTHFSTSGDTPG